ncbi:M61 family metallopeptidase [Pontibacter mangrovi]|nr:PDZ domain-containing protein [Pontibacter mangrovi]
MCLLLLFLLSAVAFGQGHASEMAYTVTMEKPASSVFHVSLSYRGAPQDSVDFKMPAWSPGYYQLLHYAQNLDNFQATAKGSKKLRWQKVDKNTWRVYTASNSDIQLAYDVKASTAFVAKNYLDATRGYIVPAGTFLHVKDQLNQPVTVTINPYKAWKDVVTGLDSLPGKQNQFTAPDFDVLYDSPFLIGNLERLTPFYVDGKPHRFVGYQLGEFDREQFWQDLQKVVETASGLVGDIPYEHYTFIGIGPGRGGIEHLNSTTVSFSGEEYGSRQGRLRLLSFLAHEYFHHYNAKRIRPVELGPFDYDRENRTNMLWVAEGGTSYYEYLILKRAGLMSTQEMLDALRGHLMAYENQPGRLYQSVTQASYNTWSDGPFGRTGDEINKTVSVYDKGPIMNLLLDFKIRHESGNKKSLDDVMRFLYREYYQKKGRGYTEEEFWQASESMAGTKLDEIRDYTSTVQPIDYQKYFRYAGLEIDTATTTLPDAYAGLDTRQKGDTLFISNVAYNSPAWQAGLRRTEQVLKINGEKASKELLASQMSKAKPGDTLQLLIAEEGRQRPVKVTVGRQRTKLYNITSLPNPTPLQREILASWLGE